MDELNVVRKRSHVWAWVVGLIVLAAIIWAIIALSGRGSTPASQMRPMDDHPSATVADRTLKL